jgi:hypothetical protein
VSSSDGAETADASFTNPAEIDHPVGSNRLGLMATSINHSGRRSFELTSCASIAMRPEPGAIYFSLWMVAPLGN